jgi:hypothetical protein
MDCSPSSRAPSRHGRAALAIALVCACLAPAAAAASRAPIDALGTITSRAWSGTTFHVKETLTVHGTVVGHDRISCVSTSATASRCSMVVTFATGTVAAAGPISQRSATIVNGTSPAVPFRILRGTGAYAGVRGSLILHFLSGVHTTEQFRFR